MHFRAVKEDPRYGSEQTIEGLKDRKVLLFVVATGYENDVVRC